MIVLPKWVKLWNDLSEVDCRLVPAKGLWELWDRDSQFGFYDFWKWVFRSLSLRGKHPTALLGVRHKGLHRGVHLHKWRRSFGFQVASIEKLTIWAYSTLTHQGWPQGHLRKRVSRDLLHCEFLTQRSLQRALNHHANGIFCSVAFFCSCFSVKIMFTVDLPALKPHCNSGEISSRIRCRPLMMIFPRHFGCCSCHSPVRYPPSWRWGLPEHLRKIAAFCCDSIWQRQCHGKRSWKLSMLITAWTSSISEDLFLVRLHRAFCLVPSAWFHLHLRADRRRQQGRHSRTDWGAGWNVVLLSQEWKEIPLVQQQSLVPGNRLESLWHQPFVRVPQLCLHVLQYALELGLSFGKFRLFGRTL